MSLARALDHDYDQRLESREIIVGGVRSAAEQSNPSQLLSATVPDTQRSFNVALQEPSSDSWTEPVESRNRKRSKDRQESSGRSRRRSTSRQRSGRSADEAHHPQSIPSDNINYDM